MAGASWREILWALELNSVISTWFLTLSVHLFWVSVIPDTILEQACFKELKTWLQAAVGIFA